MPDDMSAAERLLALDPAQMSDEERRDAIAEARAQIDACCSADRHDVDALRRKMQLLRVWRTLTQFRILDLKRGARPAPAHRPAERLFPPAPAAEPVEVEAATEASSVAAPLDDGFVSLRLIEAGELRGVRLPKGVTIEAAADDAETLVAAGKAVIVPKGSREASPE